MANELITKKHVKKVFRNVFVSGQKLSNVAYNLSQGDDIPVEIRNNFKELYKEWDKAICETPSWMLK